MIGEMKRNRSVVYVLPMLDHNRKHFDYSGRLMNVYMFEESYPGMDGYLYLLYDGDEQQFNKSDVYHRIIRHKNYIGCYQIFVGQGYMMAVFQLPKEYIYDIKKFWEGKFSEFTEFYKMQILDFHDAINNSVLHGILGKTTEMKQDIEKKLTGQARGQSKITIPNGMDLDTKPATERETFRFKDLMKFDKTRTKTCNSIHSSSPEAQESTSRHQRRRRDIIS